MLASGAPGVQRFALRGVPADRDFVLRWWPEVGREPRAAVFHEEYAGAHYVMAMLVPPTRAEASSAPAEDGPASSGDRGAACLLPGGGCPSPPCPEQEPTAPTILIASAPVHFTHGRRSHAVEAAHRRPA